VEWGEYPYFQFQNDQEKILAKKIYIDTFFPPQNSFDCASMCMIFTENSWIYDIQYDKRNVGFFFLSRNTERDEMMNRNWVFGVFETRCNIRSWTCLHSWFFSIFFLKFFFLTEAQDGADVCALCFHDAQKYLRWWRIESFVFICNRCMERRMEEIEGWWWWLWWWNDDIRSWINLKTEK